MTEIHSGRFKDATWFPKSETHVIVGGAGGISSWLSMLLARAGFLPIVYDFDILESHNLGGQMYSKGMLTMPKVDALKELISDFCDTEITVYNQKYDTESMSHHYMFSGFDNMQARKDMFSNWCEYVSDWLEARNMSSDHDTDYLINEPIFIDGRLTFEQLQIFCVRPCNIEEYKKHLFDDTLIPDAPCTLKQTSHSAAMIASHMVGFFTNQMTNNVTMEQERVVPFFWEYFIPIDYINN